MADKQIPLTPLTDLPANFSLTHRNLSGPIIPEDPADRGDLEALCPHCGTAVVSRASQAYLETVNYIDCFECRGLSRWASGENPPGTSVTSRFLSPDEMR